MYIMCHIKYFIYHIVVSVVKILGYFTLLQRNNCNLLSYLATKHQTSAANNVLWIFTLNTFSNRHSSWKSDIYITWSLITTIFSFIWLNSNAQITKVFFCIFQQIKIITPFIIQVINDMLNFIDQVKETI
jgi:hypothetical protein